MLLQKQSASSEVRRLQALKARAAQLLRDRDIVQWAESNFYIEETQKPIILFLHQKAVLHFAFQRLPGTRQFRFNTILYATPKKSGKTTVAAVVARWCAETWTAFGEVLCVGNDLNQAKERVFAKLKQSIQLNPLYNRKKEELPDQWRLLEAKALYIPNGSIVKAVATDYRGEAGANPTLSCWTELWGMTHRDAVRFWAEMAPSPTRLNSLRYIETYAGFEGESELLEGIYRSVVKGGRQLTVRDLLEVDPGAVGAFEESQTLDSLVPCYVNETAHAFAYWDDGEIARRMPWQKGEHGKAYYASEAAVQTPQQMQRLHGNLWVSGESPFVPIEWWDACLNPLPLKPGDKTPLVIGLDAAVTGDNFGLVVVSRDPANPTEGIAVRACHKWAPQKGQPIDFSGAEQVIRYFAKNHNVVQFAYDPYQLHDFCMRLTKEGVGWFRPFDQGVARMKADYDLYLMVAHRRIRHDGNADLRQHFTNANKKVSKDEDTKCRIVKKSEDRKIDLVVALSMAASECLRLSL